MNIDIGSVYLKREKEILINEDVIIAKELLKETDLLELNDVKINGSIYSDNTCELVIDATLSGIMIMECAITLKPVSITFNVEISGNILTMLKEIDENVEKLENTIDIFPIIWENILMEIPLRVVSEEAKDVEMHGNGWKLVTELDDITEVNPELEKLKDLL